MIKLTPELLVENLITTLNWYQNVLEFDVVTVAPDHANPSFARIKNGKVELMLYARRDFSQEVPAFKNIQMGGSIVLYLEVEDSGIIWEKVKDKVVTIQSIYTTAYGTTQFTIQDCNGYHLMFSSKGINEQ